MRKRQFISILTLALFLSGCSAQETSSVQDTEGFIKKESTETAVEHTEEKDDEKNTSNLSEPSDFKNTDVFGIQITEMTEQPVYHAKNAPTDVVLEASISYPRIAIAEHPAAADKINSAIEKEVETFRKFEAENAGYAEEAYLSSIETKDGSFQAYTADFSYQVKRCDDKLISIVFTQNDFSGGAHANTWSYGAAFDASSGERLYLESLSKDSAAFLQTLSESLNAQAALPAYQNYLFDDNPASIEESLLGNSVCWYFDRSGLSFICNPYVLGSYAAGTFEFNIPYESLNGLKKEYAYSGSFIRKLFPGISASYDLNGDSVTEDVCYAISTDESFSYATPVLTVNGKDFSSQFDKLYMTYLWTGAYYLMDIDPEDHYIEIAISNQNSENPAGTCTHFFRYDSSSHIVYLGNVPGIMNEDMQVRYNANGNLILCNRSGEPI